MDSLVPPCLSLSNVGANLGERVELLSNVIWWHHSTNQNFFKIYWNFLIGWMMWHCTAYRVYINPAAPKVSWKKLLHAQNLIAATPSPLLYILTALLPPLFMSKELDIHLAKIQDVVMPGTEGYRTSSTGCCSNFKRSSEALSSQIKIWFLEHRFMRRMHSRFYLSGY